MRGITKRYGSVLANDRVDFDLFPNEIHALVGENGTGKSTLMQILSGRTGADEGTIALDGAARSFYTPKQAIESGIAMIDQRPALIDGLTVLEQISIATPPDGSRDIGPRRRIEDLCHHLGLDIPLEAQVAELTDTAREHVALVSILQWPLRVLILDEPSATFSPPDEKRYFSLITRIAAEGTAVVFITHKLKEVGAIADRVTVMRRGSAVFTGRSRSLADDELRTLMFGTATPMEIHEETTSPADRSIDTPAFALSDVTLVSGGVKRVDEVSFEVSGGAIVAVTGIREYGPHQIEAICTGTTSPTMGTISLGGHEYRSLVPGDLRRHGVGYVPSDRYGTGVSEANRIWENAIIHRRNACHPRGLFHPRTVHSITTRLLALAGLPAEAKQSVGTMSGGMVQRLIFSREIDVADDLFIVSEPFWGIDLAGRHDVAQRLSELTSKGTGVLAFVSDLDDAMLIADTVVVMRRGRVAATLSSEQIDRDRIGDIMLGIGAD